VPDAYYHIYNRGINKRVIFKDQEDYVVFLSLLKRHLSKQPQQDKNGRIYKSFYGQIELLAFCLIPNHFHLLIYQTKSDAMTSLLRSVGTAYTMYFNKKYKRTGPLFQERFKASLISQDEHLQHISRYIHLNPENYRSWDFSSLGYYLGDRKADWVKPGRILGLFSGKIGYDNFLRDYEDFKQTLDDIKSELADSN
jgi:putative transposase